MNAEVRAELNFKNIATVVAWLKRGAPETQIPDNGVITKFHMRWSAGDAENIRDFLMRTGDALHIVADFPTCGTVCCIGGAACLLIDHKFEHSLYFERQAARLFGMEQELAQRLFYPPGSTWNNDSAWYATPYQAARVLEHLMKTGEVDWSPEVMGSREADQPKSKLTKHAQLRRALSGKYIPPKGYKVISYSWGEGGTIRAQISRLGAHHMTGKVYSRILGKGKTFEEALAKAIEFVTKQRSEAK